MVLRNNNVGGYRPKNRERRRGDEHGVVCGSVMGNSCKALYQQSSVWFCKAYCVQLCCYSGHV